MTLIPLIMALIVTVIAIKRREFDSINFNLASWIYAVSLLNLLKIKYNGNPMYFVYVFLMFSIFYKGFPYIFYKIKGE